MIKFIVATDQPFSLADDESFRELLQYTHHSKTPLKIPHAHGIKSRVMDMGAEMVESLKAEFQVEDMLSILSFVI